MTAPALGPVLCIIFIKPLRVRELFDPFKTEAKTHFKAVVGVGVQSQSVWFCCCSAGGSARIEGVRIAWAMHGLDWNWT